MNAKYALRILTIHRYVNGRLADAKTELTLSQCLISGSLIHLEAIVPYSNSVVERMWSVSSSCDVPLR